MPSNLHVLIALFGWPIVAQVLFFVLPPRRAVLASVLLGFMFLPIASLKFGPGIPILSKLTIVSLSALIGVAFFDTTRLLSFRLKMVDLPMVVWVLCPLASSLANDLGPYDGFSSSFYKFCEWGVPYLLGRLYLSTLHGMSELAKAIFIGGLIYVPFCLLEIRLSPQLHNWVYGYFQHEFIQTIRFGGYRPTVFMNHGIMVSTWMTMATLSGFCLWRWGLLRQIGPVQVPWLLLGLAATTILCKSVGAFLLLATGVIVLLLVRVAPSRALLLTLAILPPLFLAVRVPRLISAKDLTEPPPGLDEDRTASVRFRLLNEDFLMDKAFRRPLFGWGLWGRARIHDVSGKDITVTDSLWIIELGNEGCVGLFGMLAVFLTPVLGLLRALPNSETWKNRLAVPAVLACLIVLLFLIDCMFNDMNNPAYLMAVGGLANLRLGKIRRRVPPKPVAMEGVSWASRA
jgi:hypothetical protein